MTEIDRDRIADLAREILDEVDGDETGEPGELGPPSGFAATYDPATRRVTTRWTDAPGAVATQIHEGEKNPTATLKATVPAGTGQRTSSELAGGRYKWAACSVGPDGTLSALTSWITTEVPRKGDEQEVPGGGGPSGGSGGGSHPTDILPELEHWTITLPIPKPGSTDSPFNDYMVGKSHPPHFLVRQDRGVVFRANAGGTTTKNSSYPRSEARQMVRGQRWVKEARPSSEPHALAVDLAIDTRGLSKRRRISAVQIHDGGDDVIQLIFDAAEGLGVSHKDGKAWELIDRNYKDGQRFTCRVVTVPRPDEDTDLIQVWYQGRLAAQIEARGTGWYDKVGAYLQTNPEKWGESPDATGEVVVFGLTVEAA
jgi:hypothetical protein